MTLLKLDSKSAETIPDIQASPDLRQLPIQMVGIKDIRHPVRVKDRSQGEQHTIAQFNMYVELPHDFKGTHMSRFVEILNNYEPEISVQSFKKMLKEMTARLEADTGHIEMTFPYFINKAAANYTACSNVPMRNTLPNALTITPSLSKIWCVT